jgi:hypothetical protein
MTDTATSRNGVPIRLTDERWVHVTSRHPEMSDQRERVLETLGEPDMIQQGDFGELLALRHYDHTPLTSKFMVVAYRETGLDDGFVITAYLTNRPLARRVVLWKR